MDKRDRTEAGIDSPEADERSVPRTIGRYEILDEIGRGGMGVVYKSRQPELDRLIALKELHGVHASNPEIVQRFERESRLAGSLNHPNIVTVHDYVEDGPVSAIAMEYVPRGSLRPWVGNLTLAQLAGVLEGLLAGLAVVEPLGVVHRDLKPENVMVTDDGRVKITDFGVAKATHDVGLVSFMTSLGTTVGTPAYMAPEQSLSREVGPWTDLYSIGVMAHEQLVGRVPFHDSPTPTAILLHHANDPIPAVVDLRPETPRQLSEWVGRLLVKEPESRISNASQAWEELEEIVLELLGPRWRREARLHEQGLLTSDSKPLTPAPFESHQIQTPAPAPGAIHTSTDPVVHAQPEAESGFISYGRAPTEVGQSPPPPLDPHPKTLPASSTRQPDSTLRRSDVARPRTDTETPVRRGRANRIATWTVLGILMGGLGFLLAPGRSPETSAGHDLGSTSDTRLLESSQAYATTLDDTISRLNRVRTIAGGQLRQARSAHAQSQAATRLASAHTQAATTMSKAAAEPAAQAANAAIIAALRDMGRGYSTMANAARHENRHSFDQGRRTIASATASLSSAFVELHKLGYRIGG